MTFVEFSLSVLAALSILSLQSLLNLTEQRYKLTNLVGSLQMLEILSLLSHKVHLAAQTLLTSDVLLVLQLSQLGLQLLNQNLVRIRLTLQSCLT
jgi:hypothetical protein